MSAPNSASRWATGECEGSNQGKILPGIQWTWSQTLDTCLSCVGTCLLLTLLLGDLLGSAKGRIPPGIQWKWSHTRDMCLSLANICPLLTLPLDELQRTTWTIISLVVSNIILFSSFASKWGGNLQGLAPHAHDLPQKMTITVRLCAFYVFF